MSAPAAGAGAGLGGALAPLSARRRNTDRVMRGVLAGGAALALVPLVLIIYYLLRQGLGVISWHFLTSDPNQSFFGDPGGIQSAIVGTLVIVGVASSISIPLGVCVALYLTEYGRAGSRRLGSLVRYFVDVMTGVPSIVFGLFVYTTLVLAHAGGSSFAAWKGSIALALLMLPIVTRSAEVVLLLVPDSLREGALALGAPRWRVIARIILPTAFPGLVTGSLLAVARGAGETAPLLFASAFVFGTSTSLNGAMNSLPVQIYNDLLQAQQRLIDRAWGAAITLVALVLLLTLLARLFSRRSRVG